MAPVLSLLRRLSETGEQRKVRFYYGARTAGDLFYLDEIRALGEQLADFEFIVCLSESTDGLDDLGVLGFPGNVTEVEGAHEPELNKTEVYLCGPPPMVDAAMVLVEQRGVPADQIFFDKFESPQREE